MKRDGILGKVWAEYSENMALAETTLRQTGGYAVDLLLKLGVGDYPSGGPFDKGRLVAQRCCSLQDKRCECCMGNRNVGIRTLGYHFLGIGGCVSFDNTYLPIEIGVVN